MANGESYGAKGSRISSARALGGNRMPTAVALNRGVLPDEVRDSLARAYVTLSRLALTLSQRAMAFELQKCRGSLDHKAAEYERLLAVAYSADPEEQRAMAEMGMDDVLGMLDTHKGWAAANGRHQT